MEEGFSRYLHIFKNSLMNWLSKIDLHTDSKPWYLLWIPTVYGIFHAIQLAWTCDDAYISFVYSRNLWEGNGLVFNLGEKVEGYTNFLWTLMMSLSFPLGIRIEDFASGLGILFYGLTILILPSIYTVVCFVLFYHGAIFATSGLETSLYTFLVTILYKFYTQKKWNAMISISSMSVLVRPDGFIFFLGSILLTFYHQFENEQWEKVHKNYQDKDENHTSISKRQIIDLIKSCFHCNLPAILFSLVMGGIYILKAIYYGSIVPNTFYAKADAGEYFQQGLQYFYLFQQEYLVFSLFLVVGVLFSKSKFSWLMIAYLVYVLYIGGDFMFARFIIPIIPITIQLTWVLLKETQSTWILRFPKFGKSFSLIVLSIFLLSPLYRTGILAKEGWKIWEETGIAEERNFYKSLGSKELIYEVDAFKNVRVAFFGAQAHFVYYLRPAYALESTTGLTDYQLARTKLNSRGRIGHEKTASFDLLSERKIDLVLSDHYKELESSPDLIYTWNGNRLLWKILILPNQNLQNKAINDLTSKPNFTIELQ